ncbi:MAG: ATP-binding cassette domain-containing protein [Vicinamibacterales bacterium]
MIALHGLRKRFGHVDAVRDVTFSAADGTVAGLLGHNGAGKTTTLRMLSGLMRPDAGTIRRGWCRRRRRSRGRPAGHGDAP